MTKCRGKTKSDLSLFVQRLSRLNLTREHSISVHRAKKLRYVSTFLANRVKEEPSVHFLPDAPPKKASGDRKLSIGVIRAFSEKVTPLTNIYSTGPTMSQLSCTQVLELPRDPTTPNYLLHPLTNYATVLSSHTAPRQTSKTPAPSSTCPPTCA
jgi:hypothetical protein